jgi:dihydrodipicolinate synthase/N-acetylneuraminate lyase
VKEALAMTGFEAGPLRPPLVAPTPREQDALRQVLADAGLL